MEKETYVSAIDGLCATITPTSKGLVVCLIDADSENIIQTRIYQDANAARAFAMSFAYQSGDL